MPPPDSMVCQPRSGKSAGACSCSGDVKIGLDYCNSLSNCHTTTASSDLRTLWFAWSFVSMTGTSSSNCAAVGRVQHIQQTLSVLARHILSFNRRQQSLMNGRCPSTPHRMCCRSVRVQKTTQDKILWLAVILTQLTCHGSQFFRQRYETRQLKT